MTEQTNITREDGKFIVEAWGGYDGFLKREFDTIEEALNFVSDIWMTDTN